MLAYETEALATEAETKALSSVSRPRPRPRRSARGRGDRAFEISTEGRPSRGTTAPRDRGVKIEATSLVASPAQDRLVARDQ